MLVRLELLENCLDEGLRAFVHNQMARIGDDSEPAVRLVPLKNPASFVSRRNIAAGCIQGAPGSSDWCSDTWQGFNKRVGQRYAPAADPAVFNVAAVLIKVTRDQCNWCRRASEDARSTRNSM